MRTRIAIITVLAAAMSVPAAAACRYDKTIHHVFPAEGLKHLEVNALAGRLDVNGTGGDEIVFEARACTSDEDALEEMTVEIEETGQRLALTVSIPFRDRTFKPRYAHMDVEVRVPRDLSTSLRDSSGDILVTDLALVEIDDSSGNIRVTGGRTDLSIEDSSGNIDIRDLDGSFTVRDSSGDISARSIKGDITVPHDSSGDMEFEQVAGAVRIARDSSGDIEIEQVGLLVSIDTDSSGDIEISGVKGNVSIGRDGSGSVYIDDVGGDFELASKGSGRIRVGEVIGKVSTPREGR